MENLKGHLFALIIIIAALGLVEISKFVYNKFKLEDEVIDLRRRLGR